MTKLEAVEGTANGPGDVAGPAVRATVHFANTGVDTVSLAGVLANLSYGSDATPASPLSGPGVVNLPATLASKATADGVYVFSVPKDQQSSVTLTVDYSASAAPAVFTGSVPS